MTEDNGKPKRAPKNIRAIYYAKIFPDKPEEEHLYFVIPETTSVGYVISFLRNPESNRFKVEKIIKRDKDNTNTEPKIRNDLEELVGLINRTRTGEINDVY